MRYRLVAVCLLLGGCEFFSEHGRRPVLDFDAPPAPPDAGDPLCGFVDCGATRHCEAQCQPAGTDDCVNQCHVTCVPDLPCSMTSCGIGKTCVATSLHDCQSMAWIVQHSCDPTSSACEQLPDEAACTARVDCSPIYRGGGCTCSGDLCSCADPEATYDRCRSL
jgi:hypothetical protein